MKISLNWLKHYIDIPSSPQELEEILTGLGLEVEGMEEVQSVPGGLAGLVIGHVTSCEKHPNADRLSVTNVNVGGERDLHIVCGAPNVASGQKVVVAPVNTRIFPTEGEPFVIKKGKIRGEVSEGMICAEDEIGLGTEHDGIMILDPDASVGSSAAAYFNVTTDIVYDIGLTPNRSDATSHLGVAKDLLAYYRYHLDPGYSIRYPESDIEIESVPGKEVTVEVRDLDGCPRFSGLTISNVKIGPSPDWMQQKLRAIGVRPISNVVDITNYVLHEFGQPLHAYDLEKIGNQRIHVQTLPKGTKFTSLDEKERTLSDKDLIVCDGNDKGMCIAGVFGGIDSGVTDETTDIFLEAAHFNALQLRRTSTNHQLRTDAAKCFEKGTDPAQTIAALKRAAYLMSIYADAEITSQIIDVYPKPINPREIKVRLARVNMIIGAQLSLEEVIKILSALDITIVEHDEEVLTVHIPTNKADVTREIDVIEEILRIYGFNNVDVPRKLASTISITERVDRVTLRKHIANLLSGKGYNEMMSLSLIPSSTYKAFPHYEKVLVPINNTSNIHLDVMRPEMMFSALLNARYNINRQQKDLALFEFGNSYQAVGESFREDEWVTVILSGELAQQDWRQQARNRDFYDLKQITLAAFDRIGVSEFQVSETDDERFAYGLKYHLGDKILARAGCVSEKARKAIDIDQDVFYAELNIGNLKNRAEKSHIQFKEIPKYPSIRRALALTLREEINYDQILSVIRKDGGKLLKDISLFDIYRDKKVLGPGVKSYAVSLTFEDETKSLKDKTIDKLINKILLKLKDQFDVKLR